VWTIIGVVLLLAWAAATFVVHVRGPGPGKGLAIAVFALITAIWSLLRGEAGLELRFEPERFVLAGTPIPWAAIRDARARRRGVRAWVDLYVGPAPGYQPPRSGMWTIYPRPYGKEPQELAEMILAYRDRATGQVAGP
jgi:hypothetical protein